MARPLFNVKFDELPYEFSEDVIKIIRRITKSRDVFGIMYFRDNDVPLCMVPQSMYQPLYTRLPLFSSAVQRAVTEINVFDELISFKIECTRCEIIVVGNKDIGACVVKKARKRERGKRFLQKLRKS